MHLKTISVFFVFSTFSDISARDVAEREGGLNRKDSVAYLENRTFESDPLLKTREKRKVKGGSFARQTADSIIVNGIWELGKWIIRIFKGWFSGENKCKESSDLKLAYESMIDQEKISESKQDICQKFNAFIMEEDAELKKHFMHMEIIPHSKKRAGYNYETFGNIYSKFFKEKNVNIDDLFCPSKKSSVEWWLKNELHWTKDEAVRIQELFVKRMISFLQKTEEIFRQINDFDGDCSSFNENDDKYQIDYDEDYYYFDDDYNGYEDYYGGYD